MSNYKILMIDDDAQVLEVNRKFFQKNGCEACCCSDATKAVPVAEQFQPDCILLDVKMPEIDGFTVCRRLRKITNVPILFLSGNISEEDKIMGFKVGADDYIIKPYSLKEVYVRVIGNIRRHQAVSESARTNDIEVGNLRIDIESHQVYLNEEEILLSNKEYELMVFFAKRPNEMVTFEEIGNAVWGTYIENDRKTVMVNVSRLRKKLQDAGAPENMVETVWGKGYRLTL